MQHCVALAASLDNEDIQCLQLWSSPCDESGRVRVRSGLEQPLRRRRGPCAAELLTIAITTTLCTTEAELLTMTITTDTLYQ